MKDESRSKELCQLASVEQDPEKFMELIHEINRLLQEKEARLKNPKLAEPTDRRLLRADAKWGVERGCSPDSTETP